MKFIDISYWNGNFDFSKAKALGISGAYIKATQGVKYPDTQFENNRKNCNLDYFGGYHFLDYQNYTKGNELDFGASQAKFFIKTLNGWGSLKGALDIEDNSGSGWDDIWNLSVLSRVTKIAMGFAQEFYKELGYSPVLYLSPAMAGKKDLLGKYIWRNFTNYPLWIAQYNVDAVSSTGAWKNYDLWQYTSTGNGTQYGNSTGNKYIDINEVKHLENLLIPNASPVETQPLDTQTVEKTDKEKLDILWAEYLARKS